MTTPTPRRASDRGLLAAIDDLGIELTTSAAAVALREASPRRRPRIVRGLKAVLIAHWSGFDIDGGGFRRR